MAPTPEQRPYRANASEEREVAARSVARPSTQVTWKRGRSRFPTDRDRQAGRAIGAGASRHRHPAAPATVYARDNERVDVIFDEPQIAITPGQAAVLYDGDVVLGGGWIDS